jgi:hypothetical protein
VTDQLTQLVIDYLTATLTAETFRTKYYLVVMLYGLGSGWPYGPGVYDDVPLEELNNDRPTASTRD